MGGCDIPDQVLKGKKALVLAWKVSTFDLVLDMKKLLCQLQDAEAEMGPTADQHLMLGWQRVELFYGNRVYEFNSQLKFITEGPALSSTIKPENLRTYGLALLTVKLFAWQESAV